MQHCSNNTAFINNKTRPPAAPNNNRGDTIEKKHRSQGQLHLWRELQSEGRPDVRSDVGAPRSDFNGSYYCTGAALVLHMCCTGTALVLPWTLVLYWHYTGTEVVRYWCCVLFWHYTGTAPVLPWYCPCTAHAGAAAVLNLYYDDTVMVLVWSRIGPALALRGYDAGVVLVRYWLSTGIVDGTSPAGTVLALFWCCSGPVLVLCWHYASTPVP